jgi:hypothetical protein
MSTSEVREESRDIFTIRIVYKSGYTHDFDVYRFKIRGGTFEWDAVSADNTPLFLGADDVAAVWQIGTRREGE